MSGTNAGATFAVVDDDSIVLHNKPNSWLNASNNKQYLAFGDTTTHHNYLPTSTPIENMN